MFVRLCKPGKYRNPMFDLCEHRKIYDLKPWITKRLKKDNVVPLNRPKAEPKVPRAQTKRKWGDLKESSPVQQLKEQKPDGGDDDEETLPEKRVKIKNGVKVDSVVIKAESA